MPQLMLQGQSGITPWKEEGLAAMFRINLSISTYSPKLAAHPYFHFDLNAGCGWNSEIDCPGSPLVFLTEAEKLQRQICACFVDENDAAIKLLASRPEVRRRDVFCFAGDNGDFAAAIPTLIRYFGEVPKYATGTILCDPNGPLGIPFAALSRVFNVCERLDIVINWNSVATKRTRRAFRERHGTLPRISCLPKICGKRYWLIRESVGVSQFTVLVGRNMQTGDYRRLGFHTLGSDRGKEIVKKLDWCREDDDECPLSKLCGVSQPPCISGDSAGCETKG
jgi:hypothetical protein